MIKITFEAHSTSLDNEAHISSGHFDVALSPLGIKQSQELGKRYANRQFDAIYCSDLKCSYKTAEIAFENRDLHIIQDKRLRECDYGEYTQKPSAIVDAEKPKRITAPFPKGESYVETTKRMRDFLKELITDYNDTQIMIIGHRATQYALEHLINKVPLDQAVTAPWKWQPGWTYYLKNLQG